MYLWSNPNLPHWQRLLLGIIYLPILFWWWLVGNPIHLGKESVCEWRQEDWEEINLWNTSCGDTFFFEEGGIKDNHVIFCPFCGLRILEIPPEIEDEDE